MNKDIEASLLVKCQFKHPSIIACIKANEHLTLCDDDGYCKYCGEQDEIAVSDEPTEDEIKEPGELELSLTSDQPSFFFELASTNDENRAMRISARPPETLEGIKSGYALLCDEEDVFDLFKFTHDWLRAGEHELPLLELHTNYINPSSIDIQAKDRRTISVQYDPDREVYVVYALTSDSVWKEMTNVTAIETGKQPTGLSCPDCQHGPVYPAGNMSDGYECGHCETVFIIPGRKHDQPLASTPTAPSPTSKVKDKGEPPRDILMLAVPSSLQILYQIPESSGDEDWGTDLRDVVAFGRPKTGDAHEACVLNDAGKLVIASSLPYFAGVNKD